MFKILKQWIHRVLTPSPQSKPKPEEPLIITPITVVKGKLFCTACKKPLDNFLQERDTAVPYCEGFVAAVFDLGEGANPYWAAKKVFAIAGWNAGWQHAIACGSSQPKLEKTSEQ